MPKKFTIRDVSSRYLSARAVTAVKLPVRFSVIDILDATFGNISVIRSTLFNMFKEYGTENSNCGGEDTAAYCYISVNDLTVRLIASIHSRCIHTFTIAFDSTLGFIASI